MRIENGIRSNNVSTRSGQGRVSGGASFALDSGESASRAQSVQAAQSSTGIDALLALQAVDDPLLARKKSIRRGNALLDTLESVQTDLLLGKVSEGRLNQLMVLVASARERRDPSLDALLDDIELRARVELAKFGRYPGL
ncbi:MAG: flagellar assembly protein FliX [Devosia sp.]